MKDHAALYAAVRDLKKQVARIDAAALARLSRKIAANKAAIEKLNDKSVDVMTATGLWRQGTSDLLVEILAVASRIEMLTSHPDAHPTPEHPNEKPTPRER